MDKQTAVIEVNGVKFEVEAADQEALVKHVLAGVKVEDARDAEAVAP